MTFSFDTQQQRDLYRIFVEGDVTHPVCDPTLQNILQQYWNEPHSKRAIALPREEWLTMVGGDLELLLNMPNFTSTSVGVYGLLFPFKTTPYSASLTYFLRQHFCLLPEYTQSNCYTWLSALKPWNPTIIVSAYVVMAEHIPYETLADWIMEWAHCETCLRIAPFCRPEAFNVQNWYAMWHGLNFTLSPIMEPSVQPYMAPYWSYMPYSYFDARLTHQKEWVPIEWHTAIQAYLDNPSLLMTIHDKDVPVTLGVIQQCYGDFHGTHEMVVHF